MWIVYRGKPAPVVVSNWHNVYPSSIGRQRLSREKADRNASRNRVAVLRIDTIDGKRTYTEEEI